MSFRFKFSKNRWKLHQNYSGQSQYTAYELKATCSTTLETIIRGAIRRPIITESSK